MASCSEETNIKEDPNEDINTIFHININLKSSNSEATKVISDKELEDGTETENEISLIRFYFFDENGITSSILPATATTSDFNFFYDYTPSASDYSDASSNSKIEKIINAPLSFRIEGDLMPSQIVAVVNPNDEIKNLNPASLSSLKDAVSDFLTNLTAKGKFVMSNSVYADGVATDEGSHNPSIICPVKIKEFHLCKTPEEASKNPIDIYVERVLARLDISFSNNLANKVNLNGIGQVFDPNFTFTPEDSPGLTKKIFVKFLGWAVTSTPRISRLIKSIDNTWSFNSFFSATETWNDPDYFRSEWAINPDFESIDTNKKSKDYFLWYSFSELTADADQRDKNILTPDIDNTVTTYMQENANPFDAANSEPANPKYPTQVIFAARLIDETGNGVTIAEYQSKYFTLSGLKNLVAEMLDMYCESGKTDANGNKYEKIRPEDLDFETSYEHGNEYGPDATLSYYSYFKLKDESKNKDWYHNFSSENQKEANRISDPSAYLSSMTYPIKIWNEGATYYYFDIPHCQKISKDAPGYYGVVRNNIYNATIETITKLGTPVYNPDEIIYPENPEEETQLIVAINIFQWRLIKKKFQFAW